MIRRTSIAGQLAAHLADDGITPDEVAAVTFAGIDAGRTWIYPHPAQAREFLEIHTSELLGSVDDGANHFMAQDPGVAHGEVPYGPSK